MKRLLAAVLASLLAVASAAALAGGRYHHRHSGVSLGIVIGAPVVAWHAWRPWPYYYPYPYYPPAVVVREPPVYIEQSSAPAPAPSAQQWWYYCADSRLYYPYVKDCPGGWQRVAPQPPAN